MGNKIKIYHGCSSLGWTPSLDGLQRLANDVFERTGKRKRLDYGVGFYCTEDKNMAEYWSLLYAVDNEDDDEDDVEYKIKEPKTSYVRSYTFDTQGLNCLYLDKTKMKETLAMYLKYNYDYVGLIPINPKKDIYEVSTDIDKMRKRVDKFLMNYLPTNHDQVDYIIGWRADSHYLSIANDFASGRIDEDNLDEALLIGDFGFQVALMSEKAFSQLEGDMDHHQGYEVEDFDGNKLAEITEIVTDAKIGYRKLLK